MNKVLILGVTGMQGHTLFSQLSAQKGLDVFGTARNARDIDAFFPESNREKILPGVDAGDFDSIVRAFAQTRPDTVINCVGLIKQAGNAHDPLTAITLNSQFPHRLAMLCRGASTRMIHFSTDCVFDGQKGGYSEKDQGNATDLYGRSKLLGEVDYPHCITLRTSIIGHELRGFHGLLEWFLAQEKPVHGYARAIFSGFPTVEISRIIGEFIIPRPDISGVWHVSSEAISKYDLLTLIAERYGKKIRIEVDEDFVLDRSLDSSAFCEKIGYIAPSWPELIDRMFQDFKTESFYQARQERG